MQCWGAHGPAPTAPDPTRTRLPLLELFLYPGRTNGCYSPSPSIPRARWSDTTGLLGISWGFMGGSPGRTPQGIPPRYPLIFNPRPPPGRDAPRGVSCVESLCKSVTVRFSIGPETMLDRSGLKNDDERKWSKPNRLAGRRVTSISSSGGVPPHQRNPRNSDYCHSIWVRLVAFVINF